MCKNLVEKGRLGHPLIIYNRTKKRSEDLSAKLGPGKTKVVDSMEQAAAEADIIFTCLGDDASVTSAIVDTMIKGDVKGKLFVDCSTIHPDTTDSIAEAVKAAGARFVASPVFGAAAMAEAGQLIFVLAGAASDIKEVLPYAKGVMGRENIDFSDQRPGQATLLKIIGNSFVLQMVESLSEGHTVAEKTGLGSENLHKFIGALFPGPYTAYSQRMMAFDYAQDGFEPKFQIDLALKDARHALDLAKTSGTKMRAVEVANSHLADVKRIAGDKGDLVAVYGAVRAESGLPFGPK